MRSPLCGLAQKLNDFMESGMENLLPALHEEMQLASTNEEFERAARLRDQIESFEKAQRSTQGNFSDDLDGDFIALYQDGFHSAGSIFSMQRGSIKGSRSWIVDQEMALEGEDVFASLLFSIYGNGSISIPRSIYLNAQPENLAELEQWLSGISGSKVEIKVPQRGDKVELLDTVKRNAQYSLIQYVSKRATDAAVSGKALTQIEEMLGLTRTPLRIECFDISNISGTSVVASMVVFEDGKPQVSAAQRALGELGITDIALCGLAKRLEEVWLPNNADPLIFPRNSEGLYLLQRIRDEAHRFAITFHRSRRSKVMLESLLDEIPGLGSARRTALLDRFGSVSAIRKAPVSELATTPGIGEKLAETIAQSLAQIGKSEAVNMTTGEITGA